MAKQAETAKPTGDLKTFIENVNKKDKVSGHKIRFAFCNRKRRGG
ncbi:conserved hypothetical protein [Dehalogenimonas lykanthroporepellens BL-DC-9]|jgi:hypothetical protein|nr:conserved hypothetical protein [Dehalogenimonas lykanthroporepellens BL-DC-9]